MKHDPNTPRCFPAWLQKEWKTLEWRDHPSVVAERKARAVWEKRQKQLLAKSEKALREFRVEIAWLDAEEKRQTAIEKDREESRQAIARYVESLRTQMQAALRKQHATELAPYLAKAKAIGKEIQADRLQQERLALLRRGIVRGRRS